MTRRQRSPSPTSPAVTTPRRPTPLREMLLGVALVALAPLGIGCGAVDQNGEAEASDVGALPQEVRDALSRAARTYPQPLNGASWLSHSRTSEDEHAVYQVRGKNGRGRTIEVEVTGAGRVIEVEEHGIPTEDVPTPVMEALKSRMPAANPEKVEAVYQNGQPQPVAYGFEGTDPKGKRIEVYISADGKTFLN